MKSTQGKVNLTGASAFVVLFPSSIFYRIMHREKHPTSTSTTLHSCSVLYKEVNATGTDTNTSSPKKIKLEVAGQTLDCYCVCCELLSGSQADALLFVNILGSGIFQGRFAQ